MKGEKIRDGVIDIFNAKGYSYKVYDTSGKLVVNPYEGRYFFVDNPNFMIIVDDDSNSIDIHRSNFDFEEFKSLLKYIRNLTRKYFVSVHVGTYNTKVTPKTFSRDIQRRKTNKIIALGESTKIVDNVEVRVIFEDVVINAFMQDKLNETSFTKAIQLIQHDSSNKHLNHFFSKILLM